VIKEEHSQKIYLPNYSDIPKAINSIDSKFPEIYVSELCNVNIIGGNYIIFDDDNFCIYELAFSDKENKYDLKTNNVINLNDNIFLAGYTESNEVIEEGILLTSCASSNYSHFQIEVASKLLLVNEIEEYNNIPILVDAACFLIPQLKQELDMLNREGRKIIPLTYGYEYKVKKLIYISNLAIYPLNLKPGFLVKYDDIIIDDLAVKPINKNLSIKSALHRKLYISRRKSLIPRLENQDAVENVFKSFGYEIIFPQDMSFQDELKIFSEAEFIAGASGAGLTNIMFANENAKVIFIQPKTIQSPWYSTMAGILKLKYYFLDGYLSGHSNQPYYQGTFMLNEEYLNNFLSNI
ncbi:glycosyltransferase family 61 protein, partial [Clostridium beijerinckii]